LPRARLNNSFTLRVLSENARADLRFLWNGNGLDAQTIENGWQKIELRAPQARADMNRLEIEHVAREQSIAIGAVELH
jgi:hypothetical protein